MNEKDKERTSTESLALQAGQRVVMIVAHPDDEVIWGGGLILAQADLKWTVFSLCRASDNDRFPKFERAAKVLGVQGRIFDLDDEDKLSDEESTKEAKRIIESELADKKIDVLITHGKNGEYGHRVHKNVHKAVSELVKEGKIKAKASSFFLIIKN